MSFNLLPCSEEDAEFIEEQAARVFDTIAPPEEDAEEEEFVYKVTDAKGKLLGGCILAVDERKTSSIFDLWVDEPYRRQGIGSNLLREYEREAEANGAGVVFIEAYDWNVAFYRKNGYVKVTGVLEDYPKGHTMYCMEKPLCSTH